MNTNATEAKTSAPARGLLAITSTLALLLLAALGSGCTTSGATVAEFKLPSGPATTPVDVMPFSIAEKRFTANNAMGNGRGLLFLAIDEATALYTYGFSDKDYQNLRTSLIESLRRSKNFPAIHDLTTTNDPPPGLKLYVDFDQSGLREKHGGFECVLKGQTWVEDATGRELARRNFAVEELSLMTVGAAKNAGIKKMLKEVEALLQQCSPAAK